MARRDEEDSRRDRPQQQGTLGGLVISLRIDPEQYGNLIEHLSQVELRLKALEDMVRSQAEDRQKLVQVTAELKQHADALQAGIGSQQPKP